MTESRRTVLQIVPRQPGSPDGVGDYALRLAQQLRTDYAIETQFVAPPLETGMANEFTSCAGIILHYANYGYQRRGVPKQLPSIIWQWKQIAGGRLVTIFHELYASAPPWRSAFWLQRWQKSIARKIARISEVSVVSSEIMLDMLAQITPGVSISVHPVVSTLGEPTLSSGQFVRRDPHRWAIFGGTHLIKRSLRSFRRSIENIPDSFAPRELFVLGGCDDDEVRRETNQIRGLNCHYHPAVEAEVASDILSSCAFGWIDYFHHPDVPAAVILKSGSFANYCAHGVIPVFPHAASEISLRGDSLPGPYFIETNRTNFPALTDRAKVSADIYEWYQRHSSIEHLARGIVAALKLERA